MITIKEIKTGKTFKIGKYSSYQEPKGDVETLKVYLDFENKQQKEFASKTEKEEVLCDIYFDIKGDASAISKAVTVKLNGINYPSQDFAYLEFKLNKQEILNETF